MSDLIDRQEAIKQFCKQDCGCDPKDCPDNTCYEVEIIESVPTHETPSNTLGALDCVSREELTKEIETYFGDLPIAVHYDMLALAQRLLPVQPDKDLIHLQKEQAYMQGYADGQKPRKGKWIKNIERFGDSAYHCDQCGAVLEKDDLEWRNNYYCYHCGAKMEDNKDE